MIIISDIKTYDIDSGSIGSFSWTSAKKESASISSIQLGGPSLGLSIPVSEWKGSVSLSTVPLKIKTSYQFNENKINKA